MSKGQGSWSLMGFLLMVVSEALMGASCTEGGLSGLFEDAIRAAHSTLGDHEGS